MRRVILLLPGDGSDLFGTHVLNLKEKPMYIRVGKKSFTVSDRRPASYGVKRAKSS